MLKCYTEEGLKEAGTSVIMQPWILECSSQFCFYYAPLPVKYASVIPALPFLKCYLSVVGIFWQEKCIFHRKFCNYQDKVFEIFSFSKKCESSAALQTDTLDEAMSCLKAKGSGYSSLNLLLSECPSKRYFN